MPNTSHLRLMTSCGVTLGLAAALFASAAKAEPPSQSAFEITVGLGGAMRPTYLGSDRYHASPLPLLSLRWNDMVEFGPEGLNVYWHHDALKAGIGLAFDGGRDEKDSSTLGLANGDSRLKGMGKINIAIGYRAFIQYELGMFDFNASMTKYEGGQNKGLLARFGAGVPLHITDSFVVKPHAEAEWANNSYMQTFFGVSAQQALTSRFSRFNASSGIFDVTGGLTLNYAFDEHWFAMSDVSTAVLTGDARKSPLTYSNTATTFFTAVGYRF